MAYGKLVADSQIHNVSTNVYDGPGDLVEPLRHQIHIELWVMQSWFMRLISYMQAKESNHSLRRASDITQC